MRSPNPIRLAAVVVIAGATTSIALPAAGAAAPAENIAARHAVIQLADDRSPTLPGDFTAAMGYRPAPTDGLLGKPSGDCSSPVSLPVEFEPACKAHDLGYDLLRYADRSGGPLGGWARRSLDAALARHLYTACAGRTDPWRIGCRAMAEIATVAVRANSLRQDDRTPVREPAGPYPAGSVLLAAGLGVGAVRRWSR